MARPRTLPRLLTVLAATLAMLEPAAVGLVVHHAHAAELEPVTALVRLAAPARPDMLGRQSVVEVPPPAAPVRPVRHVLVEIERGMELTARPGGGRSVGTMPAASPYYGVPTVAWVLETSRDGRYGLVPVPYASRDAEGWLRMRDLDRGSTRVSVVADLSEHRIEVRLGSRVLFRAPAATGADASPTPTGRYFVSDRVPFSGGYLGTFAFGLSGIQPNLPPGWSGGNQLAIHGTSDPSSIGRSASAGCLRVSERTLDRLRPLLRLGTPVTVRP